MKQIVKNLFSVAFAMTILSCGSDSDPVVNNVDEGNATIPCENGMAGGFPCNGYDLVGRIKLADFSASEANDIWGWTDTSTGKEYAIMGVDNGTVFVDISDAENPVYLGKLPTATFPSGWRDVKVYKDHAFVVSEAGGHGMQVFDLTRLRNVTNAPITFTVDAIYTGFGNAHNIVINEDSGYAYAVGTSTFSGGPHFVNIQDPKNPQAAGGYSMDDYSHDAQVVTYTGPDTDYTGKEIYVGSNGSQVGDDEVVIVDVTDKNNPQLIKSFVYENAGYTHQGWFTEDQKYFILGDETDEGVFGFNTRTLIFDFSDLDNPVLHHTYSGPTKAIDHNGYVKGDTFFLANYTAGVRMLDISGIDSKNVSEVAYFDTYPLDDMVAFSGVWSVYPYLASGNIIVSDIVSGLFIIRKSGT